MGMAIGSREVLSTVLVLGMSSTKGLKLSCLSCSTGNWMMCGDENGFLEEALLV